MKVSVCVVTYNHEKYLAEALDSILMQELDCSLEIEIGEDRSTDSTLEICKEYEKKYPGIIRLHVNEKNLGPWRSLEKTFNAAKGKYIALLEGDDYWTDSSKLQHQVDFLKEHEEYAMCFTNYSCIDEKGQALDQPGFEYHDQKIVHQEDIFNLVCPPTRGVLFRKESLPEHFPAYHYETVSGDAFIFSLILKDKPACFIEEKMAVWRIRRDSLYSSVTDFDRRANIIRDFKHYLKYYTDEPQWSQLRNTIKKQHKLLLKSFVCKPTIKKIKQYKSLLFHA